MDATLLDTHGAVHPEVAAGLARGARQRCGADWGIGLTGVAGPDPQDGVSPGTVYLALCGAEGCSQTALQATGDRHAVRAAAVAGAIDLLAAALR